MVQWIKYCEYINQDENAGSDNDAYNKDYPFKKF